MTLCLFGGAFNPPHRTHERIICTALAQLPVRRLVVLPSGQHPHKHHAELAPAAARLELCRLAFDAIEGVEVDDWETTQPHPSYSAETLRHYREYVTDGKRPYWIIGSDNLRILPSWHRHHDVLAHAVPVTCPRSGYPIDEESLADLDLTDRERAEILAHVLEMEPDDVSASEIRRDLRLHRPTEAWLHPAVEHRIRELGLYGAARPRQQ